MSWVMIWCRMPFGVPFVDSCAVAVRCSMTVPVHLQVPVAEGSHRTFAGIPKDWVADFVHGDDGLGTMDFPEVKVYRQHLPSILKGLAQTGHTLEASCALVKKSRPQRREGHSPSCPSLQTCKEIAQYIIKRTGRGTEQTSCRLPHRTS